jgi:leader peptidase (prepilin peptidase) / N-methyltransferase
MSVPWVIAAALAGVLVTPVLVAAIDAVPDRRPVRDELRRVGTTVAPPVALPVALANGLLWALAARHFSPWYLVVPFLLLFSALLVLSVIDLRVQRIPDRITFPTLGASFVLIVIASYIAAPSTSDAFTAIRHALVGMVVYFVLLLIPHLISPRAMGFGDVKLALVMGLFLGWLADSAGDAMYNVFGALFYGCLLFVVAGLIMRLGRSQPFAFGPALALGTVLVVLAT